MKKIILILVLMVATATSAYAAKVPDNVKSLIKKDFPKAEFRFDGLITLPDGTLYLPLYPALVKKPEKLEVRKTIPENKKLSEEPNIVIMNNDFALLKVLIDAKGRKTVLYLKEPPIEVKTGLLPQDMLVPTGLIIPDNIKGIIGNLQIPTSSDPGLKVTSVPFLEYQKQQVTFSAGKNLVNDIPQLDNKTLYIATYYSKDIQVVQGQESSPQYALKQPSIPRDIKATPDGKFLLVTNYGKQFVNVISLADERIIKQFDVETQPEEIIIDRINNKAYIASPTASCMYLIDLSTMTLKQKIKIKGMCEKLYLSDDCTKLFYTDKKSNDVWVIELDNGFIVKNIGSFPNVSSIAFTQEKIYITSRTKNKIAIIDYATLTEIAEKDVGAKPVDMLVDKNNLYVLSAEKNIVQVFNTVNDEITNTMYLNTKGFSTRIYKIKGTNLGIVTDVKVNKYSVLDLDKKQVIKTNTLEIPVNEMAIVNKVRKINK